MQRFVLHFTLACLTVVGMVARASANETTAREAVHYRIESLPIPRGIHLEVGGLAFAGETLYVTTRRGEIWTLQPTAGKNRDGEGTWRLFAAGLHEVLGILVNKKGDVIVAQRPELTRIRDRDGDGKADHFETLTQGFGISGNYHEYHFGPVRDRAGNLYGTLNVAWVGHGGSSVPYRGWAYKLTPAGEFVPFAVGLRSPAGIGISPDGALFVTDNQGDFWPTSPLVHLREGMFYGHPAGLVWEPGYQGPEDAYHIPVEQIAGRKAPVAGWFVYGPLGHSPTEPVWDTTVREAFGPFSGQMLVGDQTKSMVTRIVLDRVGGEYQSAMIPFRHGLASGILRMAFGPDGKLYVGGTDRGWGAVGGRPFALERVAFTGKVPFEMHTVRLAADGFVIDFTEAIEPASLQDGPVASISHHTYHYWKTYGSPHVDVTSVPSADIRTTVSVDGRQIRLRLPKLATGRVYTIALPRLRSGSGQALLHDTVYYTLNRTHTTGELSP